MEAARRYAKELNHNYLGTEHLVAGLIRGETPAAALLHARGVEDERFKQGVLRLLGYE